MSGSADPDMLRLLKTLSQYHPDRALAKAGPQPPGARPDGHFARMAGQLRPARKPSGIGP
jgi:hypothetical protein